MELLLNISKESNVDFNINKQDKWGYTPLMLAVSARDLELIKVLLNFGASVTDPICKTTSKNVLDMIGSQDTVGFYEESSCGVVRWNCTSLVDRIRELLSQAEKATKDREFKLIKATVCFGLFDKKPTETSTSENTLLTFSKNPIFDHKCMKLIFECIKPRSK